jgi:hypothetical protein
MGSTDAHSSCAHALLMRVCLACLALLCLIHATLSKTHPTMPQRRATRTHREHDAGLSSTFAFTRVAREPSEGSHLKRNKLPIAFYAFGLRCWVGHTTVPMRVTGTCRGIVLVHCIAERSGIMETWCSPRE